MIRQGDETTSDPGPMAPLLPPRPNLGPEPWRSPSGPGVEWLALIVVLLIIAAVGLALWRKARRDRSGRAGSISDRGASRDVGSLGDRRVSRAETLRDALIAAFGPSWGAKTTEEIAEEPELASRIGPERVGEVVALLTEADRAKFSGGSIEGDPPGDDDWLDASLRTLVEALKSSKPAPGSDSRGLSTDSKRSAAPRSVESERP